MVISNCLVWLQLCLYSAIVIDNTKNRNSRLCLKLGWGFPRVYIEEFYYLTKRKQTLAPKAISLSNKQHTMNESIEERGYIDIICQEQSSMRGFLKCLEICILLKQI